MVVYWEYAFLENFILDGLLLFLAVKCARAKCRFFNLFLAAGVGAAEAILFPLVPFPTWAAYVVKFSGGAVIALIAAGKARLKAHLIVLAAFFLMTFALGGLLTAVYSFFGAQYYAANGFYVERAPVALVLGTAGVFTVLAVYTAKWFYRYRRTKRNLLSCTLTAGEKHVRLTGFADSGNLLTFHGEPVCVINAIAALALFREGAKEEGRIRIGTVNGEREAPVFSSVLEITAPKSAALKKNVFVTIGNITSKEYNLILHSSISEGEHETHIAAQKVAGKAEVQRKHCKLSLRK